MTSSNDNESEVPSLAGMSSGEAVARITALVLTMHAEMHVLRALTLAHLGMLPAYERHAVAGYLERVAERYALPAYVPPGSELAADLRNHSEVALKGMLEMLRSP